MQLAELLVLGLATWRIACLLQRERGPAAILVELRERLGVSHDEEGEPIGWADSDVGILTRCLHCLSVWIGLGLAGLYLLVPTLALVLALPLALSALAIAAEVIVDGKG